MSTLQFSGRFQMGARRRILKVQRDRSSVRPHDLQQERPLPLHQLHSAQRQRKSTSGEKPFKL
jgi:hypothetical protein